MSKTLVGVFDSRSEAEEVKSELINCGFASSDVTIQSNESMSSTSDTGTMSSTGTMSDTGTMSGTGTMSSTGSTSSTGERITGDRTSGTSAYADDSQGLFSGIGHFFRSLFGGDDYDSEHASQYSEALRRGGYMVSANASSDDLADQAEEIMNRHGAVDIDERAGQWTSEGWSAPRTSATASAAAMGQDLRSDMSATDTNMSATDTTKIPVVEEQLRVGKRAVQRGGVRVYTRMTEQPVEETLHLREERATIERHAADRPATEADLAAFKEGTIEVRETSEEAVVSKSARVIEEVEVGKDVTERDETVRDTVRKTDVQVEQLGDDARLNPSGSTDTDRTIKRTK